MTQQLRDGGLPQTSATPGCGAVGPGSTRASIPSFSPERGDPSARTHKWHRTRAVAVVPDLPTKRSRAPELPPLSKVLIYSLSTFFVAFPLMVIAYRVAI